jgi:ABC-type antimicrobial peptide transport system permease subunit
VEAEADDSPAFRSTIRDEVRKTHPLLAIEIQDVSTMVAATIERQQLGTRLMTVFGAVALVLAAVGIYGVIAYAASQRRTEVATRLALGASSGDVFRLMLRQGQLLAVAGATAGLILAYLSGRVVASRLYEVNASDPWILGAATLGVVLLALGAIAIPAFRSSQLDPVEVLRPKA